MAKYFVINRYQVVIENFDGGKGYVLYEMWCKVT